MSTTSEHPVYWIRYTTDKWWVMVSCCYGHPIDMFNTKPGSGFAGSNAEAKWSRDGFICQDCEALGRRKNSEEESFSPKFETVADAKNQSPKKKITRKKGTVQQ